MFVHSRSNSQNKNPLYCHNGDMNAHYDYLSNIGKTEANFSDCNIGYLSEEVIDLLQNHPRLQSFNLSKNKINYSSIQDIANVIKKNSSLTELNLENNQIGSIGITILLKAIMSNKSSKLSSLNLSNNNIDSIDANILKQFLLNNKTISCLNLDNNPLNTPDGNDPTLPILFKYLSSNQVLHTLSLKNVKLMDKHTDDIINGLLQNHSLREVNLSGAISRLNHDKIIEILLRLNDKKDFVLTLGKISDELAKLILQQVSVKFLKINANCENNSLSSMLERYKTSVNSFSSFKHQPYTKNTNIECISKPLSI